MLKETQAIEKAQIFFGNLKCSRISDEVAKLRRRVYLYKDRANL